MYKYVLWKLMCKYYTDVLFAQNSFIDIKKFTNEITGN